MNNIFDSDKKFFLNTYKRTKIKFVKGENIFLYDENGNAYMDFFSGLAVNALGYAHPKIIKAVSDQISKFAHLSNYYLTDVQIKFAEKLLAYSGMSKVFLTNSGTETTEAALKLIRKKYGPDKKIFSLTNSFHGRTYGALSLTAREKYKDGFEPFLQNIYTIDFNDCFDLEKKVDESTAAVFIEFIQGEGGINEISKEFVRSLKSLKQKFDFLIVSDAIQCGIGRTGKAFSHDYYNIKPDIILTAKAIGGGLPLGALLVNQKLAEIFSPGDHGTTFGGNPVSCAAGLVVLEEVFEHGLLNHVFENGSYLKENLINLLYKFPKKIIEVRGKGFILGIELNFAGQAVVDAMLKKNILINCTNNNVIRLLPPLITNQKQIDTFLYSFEEVIKEA